MHEVQGWRMVVNLYGTLRLQAGEPSFQLDLPDSATLRDALQELVCRCPVLQPVLFDEQGCLWADLPVFLNGRNPRLSADPFQLVLQSSDVLSLFSPISSGKINVEVLRFAGGSPQE